MTTAEIIALSIALPVVLPALHWRGFELRWWPLCRPLRRVALAQLRWELSRK